MNVQEKKVSNGISPNDFVEALTNITEINELINNLTDVTNQQDYDNILLSIPKDKPIFRKDCFIKIKKKTEFTIKEIRTQYTLGIITFGTATGRYGDFLRTILSCANRSRPRNRTPNLWSMSAVRAQGCSSSSSKMRTHVIRRLPATSTYLTNSIFSMIGPAGRG